MQMRTAYRITLLIPGAMNQKGRDDAKRCVFRLIAVVSLLLDEITIRTGRTALLPRGESTTSSYFVDPANLDHY